MANPVTSGAQATTARTAGAPLPRAVGVALNRAAPTLLPDPAVPARQLAGGRTNRVWLVPRPQGDLVVKLFANPDDNPLYPNVAEVEYAVLHHLDGRDLAPRPRALVDTPEGVALIYDHLPGPRWSGDPAPVARLLGRLHATPQPAIRGLPAGQAALRAQVRLILTECSAAGRDRLTREEPPAVAAPAPTRRLIHTDVVPANLVMTATGLRLIDWQCPALGDPAEDIASFLSPAMQTLYGQGPLPRQDAERFLHAYPDRETIRRYRILAPLYHWRIAAYCLWKAERGADGYALALERELAAIGAGPV